MNPLISVILPVYNVEKCIQRCLDSVANQSYKNLEIILVDDGSTDNSGKICDEYQANDNRIKVIHKKNAGVSAARNTGLEQSTGEYYCFIDSDDNIAENYIEVLYNAIAEHDADISCCSFTYLYPDNTTYCPLGKDKDENFVCTEKGADVLKNMLYGKSNYMPACFCKLFNRKKTGNISFPPYKIGEDFLAALDYFNNAEKVVYTNKPLYYYFQNNESVMHSNNPEKLYDRVLSADIIYNKAVDINPLLKKAASHYLMEMNMIVLMMLQDSDHKEKLAHITENIKTHRMTVVTDSKARNRIRISAFLSLFGIKLLCKIRNMITK
ncbi:MAG: glycosyltransferase family 2 protein [Clostridia bacterium]|nr:glycosyltransferase family 2 protein [Clostridia bacterium]